jgi:hypothetical protein
MSAKINAFQKNTPIDWSGLTTENHWGMLFNQYPIPMSKTIEYIYSVNLGDDLIAMMNQYPVKYLSDESAIYEWQLMGADEKNIPLKAAYLDESMTTAVSATSKAGLGFTKFYLEFYERYFSETHVISGRKVDKYLFYISKFVGATAGGYLYEVSLVDGDTTKFVPYEELVAGSLFAKNHALSPFTLSDRGADTHHTSPFRMQTWMSMMRMQETVPGNMINKTTNQPYSFDLPLKNGETTTTWLNKLDYDFYVQFRRLLARQLLYGKDNRMSDGSFSLKAPSGYEIKSAPGIRAQIAPANIEYYEDFSLTRLVDFAHDQLSIGKLPTESRKFTLMTGEHGLKKFSRAVESYAGAAAISNGYLYNRVQDALKGGSKGSFHRPQFVKLIDINGIEFTVLHNPDYDNRIMHTIRHDEGGVAESHRMTILDFGTNQGEPNIQILRPEKNGTRYAYIPGLRDPFSPAGMGDSKPGMIANPIDGYQLHRMEIQGVVIKNPLRCGEFIPVELQ